LGVLQDARASKSPALLERESFFSRLKAIFRKRIDCSPMIGIFRTTRFRASSAGPDWKKAVGPGDPAFKNRAPDAHGVYRPGYAVASSGGRGKRSARPRRPSTNSRIFFPPICSRPRPWKVGQKAEALLTYQAAQDMLKSLGLADPPAGCAQYREAQKAP